MDVLEAKRLIHGRIRLFRDRRVITPWIANQVMYDWATIAAMLLTQANVAYKIAGMYFEFQNVGSPDDVVTVPTFDRTGGVSYYNSLAESGDTDYLRVPLIASTLTSSDENLFPGGNQPLFFAQTQGTVGVNGKTFASSSNSKIYGGALVAMPVQADRTQDLIFSRFYLPTDQQQIALSNSQYGLQWQILLD